MSPEKQPRQQATAPEEGEKLILQDSLNGLARSVGPQQPDLPGEITEEYLQREITKQVSDHSIANYGELARTNELIYRRAMLQRRKDALKHPNDKERKDELIVTNQAVTYFEYFRRVNNHVLSVMQRYQRIRATVPNVPPDILAKEKQADLYIQALSNALDERVSFANMLMLDAHRAEGLITDQQHQALRRALKELSDASKKAFEGDRAQRLRHANLLNQQIIDILSGVADIDGVDKGFLPQTLLIDLLKLRYTVLLDQQKAVVRDPKLQKKRDRAKELKRKIDAGEATKAEMQEHIQLKEDLLQKNTDLTILGQQRRAVTAELIGLTGELGEFNVEMTELSTIQNHLGGTFSFEGVIDPNPQKTPEDVRKAVADNMDARRDHHTDNLSRFIQVIDEDVLQKGMKEQIEDLWNKDGRKAMRKVNHVLSKVYTFLIPEALGRSKIQEWLTEPLDEAMGWPAGKEKWEELTPEEKAEVQRRARSIADLIDQFDRKKIANVRESLQVLQSMEHASEFVLEGVERDAAGNPKLPAGVRVTLTNYDALVQKHGGAIVYLLLMQQLEGDWHAFMAEHIKFLEGVDENIDVHLEVADALFKTGDNYWWMFVYAVLGAAGLAAAWKLRKPIRRGVTRAINWTGKKAAAGPLRGWRAAAPWQRGVWVAGMATESVLLYQDVRDISERKEHTKNVKQSIEAQLKEAGFEQKAVDWYVHPSSGVEVSLKEMYQSLDGRVTSQRQRALTSGATLGTTILMGPALFAGPAGLVVIGISVTVHKIIDARERGLKKDFVDAAPPWLLAIMGTEGTTETREYDLLTDKFVDMFASERPEMRDKLFFTVFMRDIGRYAPQIAAEITAGMDSPQQLDAFYEQDFKDIVLPLFRAQLYALSGDEHVLEGDIDEGWILTLPSATLVQVRKALRASGILYLQHIREKRYLEYRAFQKSGKVQDEISFQRLMDALGQMQSFGAAVGSLDDATLEKNGGKTRIEVLIQKLNASIKAGSDGKSALTFTQKDIPGLPSDINLNSYDTVLDLIEDPAVRAEMRRLVPDTIDEPEGRIYEPNSLRPSEIFNAQRWSLTDRRAYDQNAAVSIARAITKDVDTKARVSEGLSKDAARRQMTESTIALFGKARGRLARFDRDYNFEDRLYRGKARKPIVLTRLRGPNDNDVQRQKELIEQLNLETVGSKEPELADKNIVAVVYEGRRLSTGWQVVLATYIYGDVASRATQNPQLYVVQRSASEVFFGNGSTRMAGMDRVLGGRHFLQQEGSDALLSQVDDAVQLQKRIREREELDQKATQRVKRLEWEADSDARIARIQQDDRIRESALQGAYRSKDTLKFAPGALVADDERMIVSRKWGDFRMKVNGYEVSVRAPSRSRTEIGPGSPGKTSGTKYPEKHHLFEFTAIKDGKSHTYRIDMESLTKKPTAEFTAEDQKLAQAVLGAAFDESTYPRMTPEYRLKLRSKELSRVLDTVAYKESTRWYPEDYKANLYQQLFAVYRNAANPSRFLAKLVRVLKKEKVVSTHNYNAIITEMKK